MDMTKEYKISEKDKKKLKVRKIDTQSVKAAKPAPTESTKVTQPVGLKLKRAMMEPSMGKLSEKESQAPKAKEGKVTYRKGGMSKVPQSDRLKEEVKTELTGEQMVKKLRLKQRMKTNKALKGY